MAKGKSLESDGLIVEFFFMMWNLIGEKIA
jgi:hypothetical protein